MNVQKLALVLKTFATSEGKRGNEEDKENHLKKRNNKHLEKQHKSLEHNQPVNKHRKRKTDRELKILNTELSKNPLWTRQSIKLMRDKYRREFSMTEQQIYKWWWD